MDCVFSFYLQSSSLSNLSLRGYRKDTERLFYLVPSSEETSFLVVSIGTNPTFKVKLVPMEYIPTMSERLHFFGSRLRLFNYFVDLVWDDLDVG